MAANESPPFTLMCRYLQIGLSLNRIVPEIKLTTKNVICRFSHGKEARNFNFDLHYQGKAN